MNLVMTVAMTLYDDCSDDYGYEFNDDCSDAFHVMNLTLQWSV